MHNSLLINPTKFYSYEPARIEQSKIGAKIPTELAFSVKVNSIKNVSQHIYYITNSKKLE